MQRRTKAFFPILLSSRIEPVLDKISDFFDGNQIEGFMIALEVRESELFYAFELNRGERRIGREIVEDDANAMIGHHDAELRPEALSDLVSDLPDRSVPTAMQSRHMLPFPTRRQHVMDGNNAAGLEESQGINHIPPDLFVGVQPVNEYKVESFLVGFEERVAGHAMRSTGCGVNAGLFRGRHGIETPVFPAANLQITAARIGGEERPNEIGAPITDAAPMEQEPPLDEFLFFG